MAAEVFFNVCTSPYASIQAIPESTAARRDMPESNVTPVAGRLISREGQNLLALWN